LQAFPVRNKQKSADICQSFLDGAPKDAAGAVFYGVDESNMDGWLTSQRDFMYIDNSYTDPQRGTYFRVTHNAMQHSGRGVSDGGRFRALGIEIRPWRRFGTHVVLCPQSQSFMRLAGYYGDWTADTVVALNKVSDRPIRIRLWSADKLKLAQTLHDDLRGAYCLVTHSSAAAITAILAGIPAICTGACAAAPMAGTLGDIDDLPMPDRLTWAGVLSDNQWTLDEFRDGTAWRMLND